MLSRRWLHKRLRYPTRRARRTGLLLAALLVIAIAGPAAADERLVFVSIPPQAYLVEQLVGDAVAVEVLLEPGASPATYVPSPRTVARLADADFFFAIGVPFEAQLTQRFGPVLSDLHVVNTQQGVPLRYMEGHTHSNSREHGGEPHVHTGRPDPHIWLDPKLMAIQAKTMADSLAKGYPELAETIRVRYDSLITDLNALDSSVAEILAPHRGRTMYVFHPAFGYFTDAYGLRQKAIESEGKEPSIHQLIDLLGELEHDGAAALFVQAEFSANEVRTMAAEMHTSVTVLNPLARDYRKNMLRIARAVANAFSGSGSNPADGM